MDAKKRSAVLPSAATIYFIFSLLGCSSSDSPMTPPQTNLPPQISIAGEYNHPEGQLYVTELNANDSDGDSLSLELSGDDAEQFTLTSNSLYFVDAPDYSEPADTDQNNSYFLSLTVSDGQQSATAQFQINVLEQLKRTELSIGFNPPRLIEFNWQENGAATHYKIMESSDGVMPHQQIGSDILSGTNNYQQELALTHKVNASYQLHTCNAIDCLSSDTYWISDILNQGIGTLRAKNPKPSTRFGYTVSISGDGRTMAIGSYDNSSSNGVNGDDLDESAHEAGSVQIFYRENDNWVTGDYIKPLNPNAIDRFSSVSLNRDGTVLAVGAPGEDGSGAHVNPEPDNALAGAGAVYIFRLIDGLWTQTDYIKASNPDAQDDFGFSVDLDAAGDTLVVGAINEANILTNNIIETPLNNDLPSGAVYLFEFLDGEVWRQTAYLKPSYPFIPIELIVSHEESEFGYAVSLTDLGDRLAVGAPGERSLAGGINNMEFNSDGTDAGAVFIFELDSQQEWQWDAYIKPNVVNISDRFGADVALSGDGTNLLVGAPGEASDRLGISDEIGFYNNFQSGAAYWFYKDQDTWQQTAYIKAPNNRAHSQFGFSVAISQEGRYGIIGSPLQNGLSVGLDNDLFIYDQDGSLASNGAVYQVEQLLDENKQSTGEFRFINYIKAPEIQAFSYFGWALDLDNSGGLLAIASPRETEPSVGEPKSNAQNAGAVFIY